MTKAEKIEAVADALPHIPVEAVVAYDDNEHGSLTAEDLQAALEDAWAGEWSDLAEYAEEIAYDGSGLLDGNVHTGWPFNCIDWEKAGRELEIGGDVWTAEAPSGCVYVFYNR